MVGAYAKGYRLHLGLGLWSGFRLRRMVNGLGLRLRLCCAIRLRRKVNDLGLGLGAWLIVWG